MKYEIEAKTESGGAPKKIRVLLVDDHIAMRVGIATTINIQQDMEVVGEACNGQEAVTMSRQCKPDLVIMDLRMPEHGGIEAIRALRKDFRCPEILVYSSYANGEDIYNAFQAGAKGFVVKDMGLDLLLQALRSVARGERYVPTEISDRMVMRLSSDLTPREIGVLQLVASGCCNKEIADRLGLIPGTVKVHLSNIYRKLKVNDRTQAALFAIKNKLIDVD
jgi:DNA-binding NarL/FixJ family response regulator